MHDREQRPGAGATTRDLDHGEATATAASAGKHARTGGPTAKHTKVPGGALNVDIDAINQEHKGKDSARLGQSKEFHDARRGHHNAKATQIKNEHYAYEATKSSALYDIDGSVQAEIGAGEALEINAGTLTKIRLSTDPHGPVTECVFVFRSFFPDPVEPAQGNEPKKPTVREPNTAAGWLPVSALPKAALKNQREIATAIEKGDKDEHGHRHGGRHDADRAKHGEFAAQPVMIREIGAAKIAAGKASESHPDLKSHNEEGWFTYPVPKQKAKDGGLENRANDYFGNLSLNIPKSGDPRFGVETTRIPHAGGWRFFRSTQPPVPVKIFNEGEKHPTSFVINFVYGYVETNANAKIYGWINEYMLP